MSDLRVFKNETAELATLNGILRIRIKEDDKREYQLENGRKIHKNTGKVKWEIIKRH